MPNETAHAAPAVTLPAPRSAGTVAGSLGRIIRDQGWDIAVRVLNVTWAGWVLGGQIVGLSSVVASADGDPALLASTVGARLAGIMFLSLFMVAVATRTRPIAKAPGLMPRITALGGTFLPSVVFLLPRHEEMLSINVLSSALCALGYGLAIYALAHLNRSLSIMPEARALVTSGPYRVVRHPVYLFEQIGTIGMFLPFDLVYAVPLFAAQLFCQLQRTEYEESVLTRAFPAYRQYAARTARLIPGVF